MTMNTSNTNYKVKQGFGKELSLYLSSQSGDMDGYMIDAKQAQDLAQELLIISRQVRLSNKK